MNRIIFLAAVLLLAASLIGCGNDDDSDADSETETQTEEDTETDSGTVTDPDCPLCPWGSGYPCACSGPRCVDDSWCAKPTGAKATGKACLKPCVKDADCLGTDWDGCGATPVCGLYNPDGDMFCGFKCITDDDCPPQMVCDPALKNLPMCIGTL